MSPEPSPPSSPSAFSGVPVRLEGPRDRASLQRDVLTLMARYPLVFVLLPVAIFLPFDALSDYASGAVGDGDVMRELQASNRFSRIIELVAGSLMAASILEGVRIAANGTAPTLGAALSGGVRLWGRALKTMFVTGLIVGLATLLFIVPGLILGTRYMLAVPAGVLDNLDTAAARARSSELVGKRGAWRLFLWAFAAILSWYVLALVPAFLGGVLPFDGLLGCVARALMGSGINVVGAGFLVGTALLYLELSGRAAVWPVGAELVTPDGRRVAPPRRSGQLGVALVGATAGLALLVVGPLMSLFVWLALSPESASEFVAEHPVLEDALVTLFGDEEVIEEAPKEEFPQEEAPVDGTPGRG